MLPFAPFYAHEKPIKARFHSYLKNYLRNTGGYIMPIFRTKLVEIEALQWTGNNALEIKLFVGKELKFSTPPDGMLKDVDDIPNEAYTLIIPTLEGNMKASKGDWIIKGLKGEFYPCKPDIFDMKYEQF
jgi:hypothetical protein